ncbi:MAG: CPBP family intramembrane glutamic endopeptidase [Chitinophagaceae bacterium]
MNGYLKHQSAGIQFVAFMGIYIGLMLLFLFFLDLVFPHLTGITVYQMMNGNLHDPRLMRGLKLQQILYTLVVFLFPPLIFSYLADPRPTRYLGLKKFPEGLNIILALGIIFLSFPMVGVLADWNQHLHLPGNLDAAVRSGEAQADTLTRAMLHMKSWKDLISDIFLIAVLPALAEECFFRGVFQKIMIKMFRREWLAILITGIIFSAMHGEFMGFFPRVALGIILGVLYVWSGNLWLPILAHFFNNGFQVVLMYLFQTRVIKYDPTSSNATPVLAGLLSLGMVLILFYFFQKRNTLRVNLGEWEDQNRTPE